ncbi:MAG: GNAT family N-acetyltransferase [Arhodomonas sp.]|nr:GNAT family N-acetyltransferase [Arhodomonas sp.]
MLVDINAPERILAYYSTAPCEIIPPPGVRAWKNYPHPVPFLRMARLAADVSVQGRASVNWRCSPPSRMRPPSPGGFTAIGGLVVDAKDQRAAAFYEKFGFVRIEQAGLQLFMPIQDCLSVMGESDDS